ncbi:Candidapepsin-8 [Dactylella cylindrospora]|nr:Candidapepsin-8 [Dactylella cylindrospora]
MKTWLLLLFLVSTSLADLFTRDGSSKVIRVPFGKERIPSHHVDKREETSKTVYQRLDNKDFLFYANVTVGTPPQHLRLHIDTGSSDIWVETPKSTICTQTLEACQIGGTYDNTTSTSYEYIPGDFAITYVDGQFANGDYARDILQIGGVAVKDVQFGIGFEGTSEEGILGIGFEGRQSGVQRGESQYPGLVTQMVAQDLINSRAYSVWLNDLNAESGEILFGGIDTAKFKAPLTTIKLLKRTGMENATDFIISLRGLSITNGEGKEETLMGESRATPALLDTGASFSYLPNDIADQVAELVGAAYVAEYKGPAVNCTKRSVEGFVNFQFAGVTISVKLSDFIIDATDEPNEDGSVLCYFGVIGMKEGSVLTLGDTFLRSAYVVYDMDNREVSIAPTVFNSTASNVVEIGSGPSAIPSNTRADFAVTGDATGTVETGTPNPNASTTGSSDDYPSMGIPSSSVNVSVALLTTFFIFVISFATSL